MRLPQDRILHIDTEFKDGKMNIVAEWQGELVRCKDCKHYLNEHICMYFSKHGTIETSSYAYCSYGERREP